MIQLVNQFEEKHKTCLFQFGLRDTTNAVSVECCIICLYAFQTAKIFISWFLPLGNQIGICNFLLYAVFIELYTKNNANHSQTESTPAISPLERQTDMGGITGQDCSSFIIVKEILIKTCTLTKSVSIIFKFWLNLSICHVINTWFYLKCYHSLLTSEWHQEVSTNHSKR